MFVTSTQRVMRYLGMFAFPGENVYGYGIAKALGLEPQRVHKILHMFLARGWVADKGLSKLPPSLDKGPMVRFYEITEKGYDEFLKESLEPREEKADGLQEEADGNGPVEGVAS